MTFDAFTAVLLVLREDAPEHDAAEGAALQDAHMAYLSDLHDAGKLLAAGPLFNDHYRGLNIFSVEKDEARALAEADPAVIARRFSVIVLPWMVPGGAVHFTPSHLPRSMAEITG